MKRGQFLVWRSFWSLPAGTRVVHPTGFALGWVGIRWHPTEVLHWVGIRVDTQYPRWSSRVLGIGYQVYYKIGRNHSVLISTNRQRGILVYPWHCAIVRFWPTSEVIGFWPNSDIVLSYGFDLPVKCFRILAYQWHCVILHFDLPVKRYHTLSS